MTLFILDAFQKAFGGTPDEKTVTAFAGAMDSGMRESTIVMEIYRTKREISEGGNLNNQNPGEAVVQRLRDMYRRGIR
ncbi:hypothetical protein D7Y09_08680 [bacterium 1XD42-1]|jgi:hypothetical protein|nr:hypothetical protein D7X25_07380 [bacterium 1XD42-8]RKJ64438.1 hypothetical protein D7Y09_08680 [bacterium 1XD42-1]